mgnify:CR=1 FL=1
MPGHARKDIVRKGEIGTYHTWSRCVQQGYLCGKDLTTNIDLVVEVEQGPPRATRFDLSGATEVGLAHLGQRPARVLSGGEQQRLALARAWALHPEVLFLDEPTASLDPSATHEIENVIRAFDAAGTKIVMATHNLGQARRLADEVIYLHQGRVLERAPVEQFFSRPATAEAAAFIKGELPWA